MIPISRPLIGQEEIESVIQVLKSGIIASGPKVKEFERAFASYTGVKHAVAVSNGTCAIHSALFSLSVGAGDRVIVPPFTFIATSNSVIHAGAEPVFADIEEESFNLDPDKVEEILKKDKKGKIKAVICVHLFGRPCEMDRFARISAKYGVKIIEDAAQAHGSEFAGRKAGSFGNAAAFSMYATKNMTMGEGGMVTTNSDKTAELLRKFINHGSEKVYFHTLIGYNYRTTDIEAAIGLCQLKKLDYFNERRRQNSVRMRGILRHYDMLVMPSENEKSKHIFHQFTVRVKGGMRDALIKHLNENGVGAKVFYPIALHKQPVYRGMFKGVRMPVAEKAAREVMSIPVHPGLTDVDFETIAGAFSSFAAYGKKKAKR